MKNHDVKTISGLQSLLATAVTDLLSIEKRDLHTVRATISAVNSGNSLLRTDASRGQKKRSPGRK